MSPSLPLTSLQAINIGDTSCSTSSSGSCVGGTFSGTLKKFDNTGDGSAKLTGPESSTNTYTLTIGRMEEVGSTLSLNLKDSALKVVEEGNSAGQSLSFNSGAKGSIEAKDSVLIGKIGVWGDSSQTSSFSFSGAYSGNATDRDGNRVDGYALFAEKIDLAGGINNFKFSNGANVKVTNGADGIQLFPGAPTAATNTFTFENSSLEVSHIFAPSQNGKDYPVSTNIFKFNGNSTKGFAFNGNVLNTTGIINLIFDGGAIMNGRIATSTSTKTPGRGQHLETTNNATFKNKSILNGNIRFSDNQVFTYGNNSKQEFVVSATFESGSIMNGDIVSDFYRDSYDKMPKGTYVFNDATLNGNLWLSTGGRTEIALTFKNGSVWNGMGQVGKSTTFTLNLDNTTPSDSTKNQSLDASKFSWFVTFIRIGLIIILFFILIFLFYMIG